LAPPILRVIDLSGDVLHAPVGAGVNPNHFDRVRARRVGRRWRGISKPVDLSADLLNVRFELGQLRNLTALQIRPLGLKIAALGFELLDLRRDRFELLAIFPLPLLVEPAPLVERRILAVLRLLVEAGAPAGMLGRCVECAMDRGSLYRLRTRR
jgi:hypothetical protein